MSTEMAAESMEIITMAIDKHQATKNYEVNIKREREGEKRSTREPYSLHCPLNNVSLCDVYFDRMIYVY
jgi:hypothetical protein